MFDLQTKTDQELAEEKAAEKVASLSPDGTAELIKLRQKIATATEQADRLAQKQREAVGEIERLLTERAEKRLELVELQNLSAECDGAPSTSAQAIREYLQWRMNSDFFAQGRYLNVTMHLATIAVIKPAVPALVKETQAAVAELEQRIRKTATDADIDLSKLIERMKVDSKATPNSRSYRYSMSGLLDLP